MKKLDRITIILIGVIAVSLLVSLLMFLQRGTEMHSQVLFFPEYRSSECAGEERLLPKKPSVEKDIELLIKEILLGPFNVNYVNVVPEDSKIRTIMVRGNTLYLDFSIDVVFQKSESRLSFDEAMACIKKSITFNYPQIEKFVFTVNGVEPKKGKTVSEK